MTIHVVRDRMHKMFWQGMGLDEGWPRYPPHTLGPGEKLHLALFPDTIEAENLKVIATENCIGYMRDTSPHGRGVWSNDRELFGGAEKGGYLELEVNVPQKGPYALGIYFTKAPDFGVVEVSLDDQRLNTSFDGFNDCIIRGTATSTEIRSRRMV